MTDTPGAYRFTGCGRACYAVAEITPDELIDGEEHVGTVNGIQVGVVAADDPIAASSSARPQDAVDYDFCEYVPASLSGTVYHDRDNDGRRESGEEGLAAVRVTLLDSGGNQVGRHD